MSKKKKKTGAVNAKASAGFLAYLFYPLSIATCGFLFSLSLAPFSSGWAGFGCLVLMAALAFYLRNSNIWLILFTGWLLALSFQLFAFFWIPGTIQVYGGTSRLAATFYGLLYSLLYQLRVPLLFLGFHYSFRLRYSGPLLVALAAMLGDRFAPQVFNWYWGNLTEGWVLWRQLASLGGIYLPGAALAATARALFDAIPLLLKKFPGLAKWKILGMHDGWAEAEKSGSSGREAQSALAAKGSGYRIWLSPALLLSGVLIVLVFGYVHLYRIETAISAVERDGEIRVAMFQTATSRKLLGSLTDYDHAAQSMNEVVSQALQAVYKTGATLDLMILPESAIPYHGVSPADKRVYSVTMHALLSYMNGISHAPILFNQLQQGGERIYNTASLLGDGAGQSGIQNYRKRILIPFGEYLPGEQTFPWLRQFFPNAGRYSPEGTEQPVQMQMTAYPERSRLILLPPEQAGVQNPEALWTHPGDAYRAGRQIYRRSAGIENNSEDIDPGPAVHYRFGILICYEDLIPELGISSFSEKQAPDFLVNISNDSWLSHSRAMWQHYGAARFRSIETGRFLLRSTLTGISGVMDPAGRDYADHSTIDARGTILEEIPVQARVTTLFSLLGDWTFFLIILLCLTAVGLDGWMQRKHR